MKLVRYPHNPILSKNPLNSWEAGSVLNPNVFEDSGIYRMLYRATNNQRQENRTDVSSVGYAESRDGIKFERFPQPLIYPTEKFEKGLGCEDARVTKIDGKYFVYYTAVDGFKDNKKVRIALATSSDFKKFTKHGIVGPDIRSKAAVLFPKKINGEYILFYTGLSDSPKSSIMVARFKTLDEVMSPPKGFMDNNFKNYKENVVIAPTRKTFRGPEIGATPIKTDRGWLLIYCSDNTTDHAQWSISAALLDLRDPQKVLSITEEPILKPETESEKNGDVSNVTFPAGAIIIAEELYVYYGSGDQGCCLATCNYKSLVDYLYKLA